MLKMRYRMDVLNGSTKLLYSVQLCLQASRKFMSVCEKRDLLAFVKKR